VSIEEEKKIENRLLKEKERLEQYKENRKSLKERLSNMNI